MQHQRESQSISRSESLELRNRAGCYELFSRFLIQEVDAATLDLLHTQRWARELAELSIRVPESTEQNREDLAVDYCRIFIGPKDFCPPYQSVWENGQFQGQVVTSMSEFLDVIQPLTSMSTKDHVGLQFEIMSQILRYQEKTAGESFGLPENFFRSHVAWAKKMLPKAINLAETDFYRDLLSCCRDFVDDECHHYGIES